MAPHESAARSDPVSGPAHQIQWLSQVFETRAGPKLRVGLIEQPVIGMAMTCARKTARPIAIGARFCLLPRTIVSPSVVTALVLTAVSRTTKQSRAVATTSTTKAFSSVTLEFCRPFEPSAPDRSRTARAAASPDVVNARRPAPAMDPRIWATKYQLARTGWHVPTTMSARVTAQLMCPPRCAPLQRPAP